MSAALGPLTVNCAVKGATPDLGVTPRDDEAADAAMTVIATLIAAVSPFRDNAVTARFVTCFRTVHGQRPDYAGQAYVARLVIVERAEPMSTPRVLDSTGR